MRRFIVSLASAGVLTVALAGTALGAHCVNESKPDGAGVRGTVLINPATGAVTFIGANAAGRLPGGFADVYLDLDGSGTVSEGDLRVENDTFLVANHSHKHNPAQGTPAVLPPVLAEADPGGEGKGIGVDH
jgi:hypothetical protein